MRRKGRARWAAVTVVITAVVAGVAVPESADAAAPPDLLVVQTAGSSTIAGAYRTTIGWTVSWSCASLESPCRDTTLSDTLPAGLTVKEVSGAGGLIKKVTVVGNTVTWELAAAGTPGLVDAGSVGTLSITAAAVCSAAADQVFSNVVVMKASNAATATSDPSPITVKAASSCAPPRPPNPSKTAPSRLNAGAAMPFSLRLPYAPSAYTVVDPTPAGLLFQKVTIEAPGTVTVSCDAGKTYQIFDFSKAGPFGKCVKASGFWNVTHSKFAVPAHSDPGWSESLTVKGVITTRVPVDAPIGTTYSNITLTGGPVVTPLTASGTVVNPGPAPTANKTREVSPGTAPPLDFGDGTHPVSDSDLGYVITFGNNGNSETAAAPLIDPTVIDLLDPSVDFVPGESWWRIGVIKHEANLIGSGCRTPAFENIPNWSGTGRTLLRWKFTNCAFPAASLGNNPTIKLHLDVRLKPGIAPGTSVLNRADILGGNGSLQPMLCDIGSLPDVQDLDGDGDVTESTCSVASADTWIVPKLATVDATKWVNGAADEPGVFSRFPNVGSTSVASDGRATYHLFIDMRGNITASRIQLIDILPYIGDTSALSATVARKSGWTEELDGPVEVAFIDQSSADSAKSPQAQDEVLWQPVTAGLTLKYSSSTNPCRLTTALLGQMHLDGSSYPKGCTQNPWDLTDPVGARAFGVDVSVALDPFNPGNGHGDMLRLTVTVKDINDVPTADDADKVAWNSFAYTVTDTDGYEFLSAEPIKVGVAMRSESPPPPPAEFVPLAVGDVVWWDHDHDGVQDAGEPPISGVNVVLYDGAGAQAVDANGRPVAPVVTDAAGHYVFDNLRRGNYQVRFGVVAGAVPTRTAAGGDRLVDSNPDGTGLTPVFALDGRSPETRLPIASDGTTVAELIDPSVDAGFWIPMAIGDEVWLDGYRNGRQDAGESPVARVTLALLNADGSPANDADGVPVPWAVTNESGRYLFDNLLAGDYRVRFTLPPRYEWTLPRVETDVGVDSNPDDDGLTPVFQLSPGSPQVRPGTPEDGTTHLIDPTIDAGIWLPAVPTVILPETA